MAIQRVLPGEAKQVRADTRAMEGELADGDRIRFGDTGKGVEGLQRTLKAAGFFKYPDITGYFGPITKAALVDFQKSQGLRGTGVVNDKTLAALKHNRLQVGDGFDVAASRGQAGKDILGVEKKLKAAGFDPGNISDQHLGTRAAELGCAGERGRQCTHGQVCNACGMRIVVIESVHQHAIDHSSITHG